MNILQLVPKLNIGGVEKGTVEVARYLTLNGHKAVVASEGGVFEKNLAAVGARHYKVPVGRKNPLAMIYSYIKLKQLIRKENIDIVHARSRIPALTGYFATKATGKTFVTTAHGQYKKHLISRVMGWGRVVIVANETMARYMNENFNVPLRKISVVPRGVDLKKFSFTLPSRRKGRSFRIGMICRFTPLKGHIDFLKAASYVARKKHNIEIVLMGDRASAKEEYMKKIELTIRRLMLGNIVTFKDASEDVAKVMEGLDVLVSANREQEAFGRTIIEAQAKGVPVVATRIGGVVENIEDGVTGLFSEPGAPLDIAEKIMLYQNDPALMDKVAAGARKFVEEHYSLDRMMQMTMEAYSRALSDKNILIFKISSLGDVILNVPSIRAIRARYPSADIKLLVDVRFREVLDNCPYINEVITCDFGGRDRGIGFLRLAKRLRAEDINISVDFQNNRRSHLLAYLAAIPERYGYANGKLSFLINRKTALPKDAREPVRHQGCILGLMGITDVEERLELWPDEQSEKWAERFLESNWLKKGQKIAAFSLSASKRWKTKNWGITPLAELADELARKKGVRVVIIGSGEDRDLASEFMRKTTAKPIDAVGKTNIPRLASLIKRCDVLLAGDSAPMHVAAAMGTPLVAIFGPTDPERHAPPSKKKKIIYKKIKCAPCYKPVCQKRLKCMTSIKPEEVFNALMDVMGDRVTGHGSRVTKRG